MKIEILTILPGVLHSYLQEGMIGRAVRDKRLTINLVNVRNYAEDRHQTTDDTPYGGGPGQLMKAEPLANAVKSLRPMKSSRTIFLTPQGKPFAATDAKRLAKYKRLVLVCGRYEGVDQRFRDRYVDEELSIGDYVLTGGELPALVVLDAVARFVPGVLGNQDSAEADSFSNGLLEHPQYTKPRVFEGLEVPAVLLSGNHSKIEAWRQQQSEQRTRQVRPDLLKGEIEAENLPVPERKTGKQKKG